MTILDKIIAEKKKEVARLKEEAQLIEAEVSTRARGRISAEAPDEILTKSTTGAKIRLPRISFYDAVRASESMSIIAEIKRASPSKGIINDGVDPVEQAKVYAENGVHAISVLTDTPFFKGTMDDLRNVRSVVDVPVLCKDFIIDPVQIDRAKQAGANMILLIAAALDDAELKFLYDYALGEGLEVLAEVHNETEMERVLRIGAKIIGVNNRNLKTFEVDLATTGRLADMVTNPDIVFVSESGIETVADVEFVRDAGARAILVGETFMRAENLSATIRGFQVPLLDAAK